MANIVGFAVCRVGQAEKHEQQQQTAKVHFGSLADGATHEVYFQFQSEFGANSSIDSGSKWLFSLRPVTSRDGWTKLKQKMEIPVSNFIFITLSPQN